MASFPSRLATTAAAALLLGVFSFGVYRYTENGQAAARSSREADQLQAIAQRLAKPRSAEIVLTGRTGPTLHLLFIEYAANQPVPTTVRPFTVPGPDVHLDAEVVRLGHGPFQGTSVTLFTRIYGSQQTPDKAARIDSPGGIPDVDQGADPTAAELETKLWTDLWKSLENQQIAQGPGITWQPREDRLYRLSVRADGTIALTDRPVATSYVDAMRKLTQTPSTMPASASADEDPEGH